MFLIETGSASLFFPKLHLGWILGSDRKLGYICRRHPLQGVSGTVKTDPACLKVRRKHNQESSYQKSIVFTSSIWLWKYLFFPPNKCDCTSNSGWYCPLHSLI